MVAPLFGTEPLKSQSTSPRTFQPITRVFKRRPSRVFCALESVCRRCPSTVLLNGMAAKLVSSRLVTAFDLHTCAKLMKPVGVIVTPPQLK